jgi:hypothetical protein
LTHKTGFLKTILNIQTPEGMSYQTVLSTSSKTVNPRVVKTLSHLENSFGASYTSLYTLIVFCHNASIQVVETAPLVGWALGIKCMIHKRFNPKSFLMASSKAIQEITPRALNVGYLSMLQ